MEKRTGVGDHGVAYSFSYVPPSYARLGIGEREANIAEKHRVRPTMVDPGWGSRGESEDVCTSASLVRRRKNAVCACIKFTLCVAVEISTSHRS